MAERIGYLGLGSNVGERREQLETAVAALRRHGIEVVASSPVYETEPVGEIRDQRAFLNACLQIRTGLDPEELLDECKAIERELGRDPGGPRHGPRPIDIDVLLIEGVEHRSDRLTLPHRDLLARRFVLVPMLDIDAEIATPAGARLAEALAALDDQAWVREDGPPLV